MSLLQRWRFSIIPAGYVTVLLLVSLAILNPTLPLGSGAVDLLLLLDESSSISPEENNAVWLSSLQKFKQLPGNSRISLLRFADRASIEIPWTAQHDTEFEKLTTLQQPPRHRYLDQGATDISSALKSAIQQVSPDRQSAILVSSDGKHNVTAAESTLPFSKQTLNESRGLSIFYLNPVNEQTQASIRIESINLPSISKPGQLLPLSIAVESTNGGQGVIEIFHNKTIVINQSLLLQPGKTEVLNFQLTSQPDNQNLSFLIRDQNGTIIDRHRRVVTSKNNKQLLYITDQAFSTRTGLSQLDDWKIVHMQPQDIPADENFFSSFDIVVINDLEADLISAANTKNLLQAIELSATGLVVLGGPHSFGSGGYRHSELETALPVSAEAARPLPGSAFLFLLDKSGSMEAASRTASRFADALRAVSESTKSLRPGDESALLVFDRDVEILLPLQKRLNAKADLDQDWRLQPSGGTQLVPALEQSIELLTQSEAQRRFLILVSDGFVDDGFADSGSVDSSLAAIQTSLTEASIQLIVLAIGNDADISSLQKLATSNGGQVLQINDTAQLPRFMRQQLETKQQSWQAAPVIPHTLHQAPFITEPNTGWLQLAGHQLTRAKPSARVYVATKNGDPLLAVSQYGAGRVAALPGGMLHTVSADNVLNALLNWLDSHQLNPNLKVSHHYHSAQLTIRVDAVDTDHNWYAAETAEIILTSPAGIIHTRALEIEAPGRFVAVLPATSTGIYNASIKIGSEQTLYSAWLASDSEHRNTPTAQWLEHALSNGDIKPWTDNSLDQLLALASGSYAIRPLCLILALGTYLSLIAFERSSGIRVLMNRLSSLIMRITSI